MKKIFYFSLFLLLLLVLSACSDSSDSGETVDETEMGDPVPSINIFTQLPEANLINSEIVKDIVEEWEGIGIEASAEPMDFNVLVDRLYGESPDFDAFTLGWAGMSFRIDPDSYIESLFHSNNAITGGNNIINYKNSEYDALAEAQRTEMDPEARREVVFEAQEMLVDEAPITTLYVRDLVHAYNHERFENITPMAGEGIFNEWMPMNAQPLTDDKTLRVASIQDLDTINPVTAVGVYEWRNLRQIYDMLFRLNPASEPEPAAATDWEVVDDVTVDVTLREGMTFHDGEPVTVDDVKFSYDYFKEHEIGYFLSYIEPIESIETIDDSTIRFNLKEPYAPLVSVTFTRIPIIPMHIWENLLEEEGLSHPDEYTNDEAIGSGPFVFEDWKRGEHLRTSTFDDFYEEIAIDGYTYDLYANDEAVMTALETGTADVNAEQFIPANIERAQELSHLTIEEVPDIGFQYLGFNIEKAPFNDKAFRQAMAHTIDFQKIVDVYLDGYGLPGGASLLINQANEFWFNPDVERPQYDIEKAREILEEAGYTWDSEGKLRMPVGMSVEE